MIEFMLIHETWINLVCFMMLVFGALALENLIEETFPWVITGLVAVCGLFGIVLNLVVNIAFKGV